MRTFHELTFPSTDCIHPSSAALSLARTHVTRATIGGRPPLPSQVSCSVLLGGHPRFVGTVARKKGTMTIGDAPSGGSGHTPINPYVVIGAGIVLVGTLSMFALGFFGIYRYSATSSGFESKINGSRSDMDRLADMLGSRLDGQDCKIAGQDCKIAGYDRLLDGFRETIGLMDLKYEPRKLWSWFGRNASFESDDPIISYIASKVNEKADAIVTDKLDAMITDKLDAMITDKLDAMITDKLNAKLKEMKAWTGDQASVINGNSSKN
jgi:hypothetical protein